MFQVVLRVEKGEELSGLRVLEFEQAAAQIAASKVPFARRRLHLQPVRPPTNLQACLQAYSAAG